MTKPKKKAAETKRRGPSTLYPDKDRARSIHVQMPDYLHDVLTDAVERLRVRPGDLFCALLERYAKSVRLKATMTPEDCARVIEAMKTRAEQ